jgi:hypothetical protein
MPAALFLVKGNKPQPAPASKRLAPAPESIDPIVALDAIQLALSCANSPEPRKVWLLQVMAEKCGVTLDPQTTVVVLAQQVAAAVATAAGRKAVQS